MAMIADCNMLWQSVPLPVLEMICHGMSTYSSFASSGTRGVPRGAYCAMDYGLLGLKQRQPVCSRPHAHFHFRFWSASAYKTRSVLFFTRCVSMPSQSDGSVNDNSAVWNGVRRMPGVCVLLRYSAKSMVRSGWTRCVLQNTTPLQSTTRKFRALQNIREARKFRNGKMNKE